MRFDGGSQTDIHCALPFTQEDYFELVDVTGRIIREDKRGYIPDSIPSVVLRLGIQPDHWIDHIQNFGKTYSSCAGSVTAIADYAERKGRNWCKGVANSARCYCLAQIA